MERTIEMLVEYVLERCTSLETENMRLASEVKHLTEQNDRLYGEVAKSADRLAEVTKLIRPGVKWENGKVDSVAQYNKLAAERICELLRIETDEKTTV